MQYDKVKWTSKPPILLGFPDSIMTLLDQQKVQFQNDTISAFQFHTVFFVEHPACKEHLCSHFTVSYIYLRKSTRTVNILSGFISGICCFLQSLFICFLYLKIKLYNQDVVTHCSSQFGSSAWKVRHICDPSQQTFHLRLSVIISSCSFKQFSFSSFIFHCVCFYKPHQILYNTYNMYLKKWYIFKGVVQGVRTILWT